MDNTNPPRKFSYPNSDQNIPGVSDPYRIMPEEKETQAPKPVVHIEEALNENPKKQDDIQTIRTYQADIASAIKNDNVSMIKVALAEKKRQERQGSNVSQIAETSSIRTYVIIGLIVAGLLVAGGAAAYMFLASEPVTPDTGTPAAQNTQIIYTEARIPLNIDQRDAEDIERLVRRERDAKLDLGTMKQIEVVTGADGAERKVTASEFLTAMNARTSSALVRSIDDAFQLGVYSFTPHDIFAIFKINSYDSAFAGMLEWEANMETDIGGLFIYRTSVPAASTATATSASINPLFTNRVFVDKVLSNKDVRALVDESGEVTMLYTFIDKETLVIATSDKALKEVIFRLTAGRIVR